MRKYVEVRGCMNINVDGDLFVEEVDDEFAEFFGLYVEDERGYMMWHSDYDTREEAEKFGDNVGDEI